ncbi:hypothetical protein HUA74_25410 [Myxococcus sp. CA051A]|uniref:hypothetical protein n=1 Tax=unclassified Myxococcus TaxID=2648731 RepID=UPI00157B3087|nr:MULTISPECIES: hypothetical protein [unclassified Myxococcus]NTX16538.1 hypothetical protein [Myxococcus sp. CA056]NTX63998.1 hypothetical protein [Myxococcus sp. CA051A]
MRNLTGVLVFSTTLLLVHGCHKNTGEAQGPADASLPAADAQGSSEAAKFPSDSGQALHEAAPIGSEKATADSGTLASGTPDAATPPQRTLKETGTPEAHRAALESCVDRWLKKHKLDEYGNAEGTMYAGGTPLFDERTGESTDRLTYVFNHKPEARKVCMQPSSPR